MKWDFFYDENAAVKYRSFADWKRETRHIHRVLIISLLLIGVGLTFFSIFPIS